MKIHEYQAKAILKKYGVPVPRGEMAATQAEAESAAQQPIRVRRDRCGGQSADSRRRPRQRRRRQAGEVGR